MAFNILIVDDSLTIRAVIKRTLIIADVPTKTIFEASDGQEALDILNNNWVDLVFSDLNMPGLSGFDMIKQMRDSNIIDDIPVVVISTEGSLTRVEELKKLGIRAYIHKPFTPEQIKSITEQVMGKWK